jgi:hypothetical protein
VITKKAEPSGFFEAIASLFWNEPKTANLPFCPGNVAEAGAARTSAEAATNTPAVALRIPLSQVAAGASAGTKRFVGRV